MLGLDANWYEARAGVAPKLAGSGQFWLENPEEGSAPGNGFAHEHSKLLN